MGDKVQTQIWLSKQGRALLEGLKKHYGMSYAAVIELCLREKATDVGVTATTKPRKRK